MIRRPPRSTRVRSSAASDVYKRQIYLSIYLSIYINGRRIESAGAQTSASVLWLWAVPYTLVQGLTHGEHLDCVRPSTSCKRGKSSPILDLMLSTASGPSMSRPNLSRFTCHVDARDTECARVSVPSGLRRALFFCMRAHIQSCAPCARSHFACRPACTLGKCEILHAPTSLARF